tara:strand:- start:4143 stop:4319 length:177 start_codon:yes stop_codon:yes gene_type:complete
MKGMSRIFIEDRQVEELLSPEPMDVFESMDDILEDEYDSKVETEQTDWFGGDDPLAYL